MGKMKTQLRYSIVTSAFFGVKPPNPQLDADRIASLLPGKTSVLSINQLPIASLCIEYDVELENPWFPDGTTVEEQFKRDCHRNPDPNGTPLLLQYNVHQGIKIKMPNIPVAAPTPAVAQAPTGHQHDWKHYRGFTDVYQYCDCGAKK